MVQLEELMMILDLHRHGLSVPAIARCTGRDPKTIRKYSKRGPELPAYGPRQVGRPNKITPYLDYVRERIAAFTELKATRRTRELREHGYTGAYTAMEGSRRRSGRANDPSTLRFASRRGQAIRPRSTSRALLLCSTISPASPGSASYSRWYLAILGAPLPASGCVRIC